VIRERDDGEAHGDIAARVADGADVAWDEVVEDDPTLRHLQWIERIGEAYRESGTVHDRTPVLGDDAPAGSEPHFVWGPLDVFEEIGRGSSAVVYRAYDRKLDRPVALKLFDAEVPDEDGLEEARRLARVRQENLLSVFGADVFDGRHGLWTESVLGMDLEDELRLRGCWSATEALDAGITLCGALGALHEAGLAHGDLTPRNVLRERGGRLVIVDLGASTDARRDLRSVGILRTGTPFALPPECLEGKPTDARDDLYALGVLLYRMLTDFHPIEADSLDHLLHLHREHGPLPLRARREGLPESLGAVIDRALDRDPTRRYASAASMERALKNVRRDIVGAPRSRRLAPALALVGIALALGVGVWFRGADPAPIVQDPPRLLATRDGVFGEVAAMQEVRVGERVHLELNLDGPQYVYVLNEDGDGDVHVLFPLDDLDAANPLGAGEQRLPGTVQGRSFGWQVTSAGGEEHVLVLRAASPIDELESMLALLPEASQDAAVGMAAERSDLLKQTLRGMAGLVPSDVDARAGEFLAGLVEDHDLAARDDVDVDLLRYVSVR